MVASSHIVNDTTVILGEIFWGVNPHLFERTPTKTRPLKHTAVIMASDSGPDWHQSIGMTPHGGPDPRF